MINIKIDKNTLKRIIKDTNVKLKVECNISEHEIKYLIKELENLNVSEETLKTLRVLDR
jgi:hypothetical protein